MSGNAMTLTAALVIGSLLFSASACPATVSQVPLTLGGGSDVPRNLALVLATDEQTMVSLAHPGDYSSDKTYPGYFDPHKCYLYDTTNERFEPNATTRSRKCTEHHQWSGNFLNWAGTLSIDLFRSILTGGYRFRDSKGLTVLSKSRNPDNEGKRRGMVPRAEIMGAAPVSSSWSQLHVSLEDPPMMRATGSNTYMYISNDDVEVFERGRAHSSIAWVDYDSAAAGYLDGERRLNPKVKCGRRNCSVFRVNMRVRVCVPGMLESNCKAYPGGSYKPEGLLQKHSDMLRYSVFGYLNDNDLLGRDGGVLRAGQKFVGNKRITPGVGEEDNPAREWDPETGILVINPDNVTRAMEGVNIHDSGVINYINKSGQINDSLYRIGGSISELYYTATRYFRNIGNVYEYSSPHPASFLRTREAADSFPVITDWQDPLQYACQKNAILGIAAADSWNDKNLPGSTSAVGEPIKPHEVVVDRKIDVVSATQAIFDLEGIAVSASASEFTVNHNSAYIAGLAYLANTRDLRPDLPGRQTISTFWVDVQSGGTVKPRRENQYWLAAKYGGFRIPEKLSIDPYARRTALPEAWWHTSGDRLPSGDLRPDNFFVASEMAKMEVALDEAFKRIVENSRVGTTSAATPARLAHDKVMFQASFDSARWSGDLVARTVDPAGRIEPVPVWSAADRLDRKRLSVRKIFTPDPVPGSTSAGGSTTTHARQLAWGGLSSGQRAQLIDTADDSSIQLEMAEQRLNYLRGERSWEQPEKPSSKDAWKFRRRDSRLGDIVNSVPQYVGNQNFGYTRLPGDAWKTARETYADFLASKAGRKPMIVVGANDGMLHGFDASLTATGGDELFAFIPLAVFSNLKQLTQPNYAHRYYVDGTPRVSDAWIKGEWKTILAGTTGAGGRSVFALDVSEPERMGAGKFLWEFTHPDMGYTIGQPAIVALANGQFAVVVTSGYESAARDNMTIWFLDAATGSVITSMTLAASGDPGAPLLADTTGDGVADRLYVADTAGHVWRSDISARSPHAWTTPSVLFRATDGKRPQPITAPLASAFNDKGEHMLLFGTGSYLFVGDNEISDSPQVQSFYGIVDTGRTLTRHDLQRQAILHESKNDDLQRRTLSRHPQAGKSGWYLDLAWQPAQGGSGPTGERVVVGATPRGDHVLFTTLTPSSDVCVSGGTSWVMALDLSSGARLDYDYFEPNPALPPEHGASSVEPGEAPPASGISDSEGIIRELITPLSQWLCYSNSKGDAQCIEVADSALYGSGRKAWQEMR
ncbi:MAG TPA: PilC/PilY family type IV pilus protein [Pseudomonas sp.]